MQWMEKNRLISLRRQCELLGLPRSSWYYEPVRSESEENLRLMRDIDELYLKYPFYGSPRITFCLKQQGWRVNAKRVARLMRVMGLQATLPGPHTSRRNVNHEIYPYLLKGLKIKAPNEVWCADITYIPLRHGYMYLVAIMDWFSRYVISWEISNTLDSRFCVEALNRAIDKNGCPFIYNTDQGSQFTSEEYISLLKRHDIKISMDGKGRALDNIFIERLWRSVKYEDVYLNDYQDGISLRKGLSRYFRFYNTERPHNAHENKTPEVVFKVA